MSETELVRKTFLRIVMLIVGVLLFVTTLFLVLLSLNPTNPAWEFIGLNVEEFKNNIDSFPEKNCSRELQSYCEKLSHLLLSLMNDSKE